MSASLLGCCSFGLGMPLAFDQAEPPFPILTRARDSLRNRHSLVTLSPRRSPLVVEY